MTNPAKRDRWTHRLFQIGVAIKGIDGIFEVIGGALMLAFGPTRINHILEVMSRNELHEDAHDVIANLIARHTHFSADNVHFAAAYLLFQGSIKVWLAEALLRERRRVFPVALFLLGIFELYLLFKFTGHASLGIALLALINLAILVLVIREYRRLIGHG